MRNYEYSLNDRSRQRDPQRFHVAGSVDRNGRDSTDDAFAGGYLQVDRDSMKQGRSALALNSTLRNIVMRLDRDLEI